MGLLWIYLDIYIQISVIVLKTHWRAQVSYVLSPCKRGTAAPRASTRSFLLPRTTPGSPRPQGLSTTPQCTEAPCCTDAPTVMVTCHFPPLIVSPGEATAPEGKGRALPEESGWLHNYRPSTSLLFSSSPCTPHHMTTKDYQCLDQQSASQLLVWKWSGESQWSCTLSSRKIKPMW